MTVLKRMAVVLAGLLVAVSLMAGGFMAGGRTAGTIIRKPTPTPAIEGFGLFYEAWHLVEQDYVGELPPDEVVARGATRGVLRALGDSATALIAPEYAAISREDSSGFYKGIGASVRPTEDGYVGIGAVTEGSPAEEVGIRAGDVIVAVEGEDIQGRSLYEVVNQIRGPAGTKVQLRLLRPSTGETYEVDVERREIEIRTVDYRLLPEGVAYVRLNEFNNRAVTQLRAALRQAQDEGAWALVLDLRDDPGGFLDQAVLVADEFLDEGLVLIERGRLEAEKRHRSSDGGIATDMPLAVLINGGSASASEIVAGAVQAQGRGLLVGEQSFGKGSVQFSFELSDGSELRVTTALWYTPDDQLIQGAGLTPDIEVAADETGETDPQLDAAVRHLMESRP